MTVKTVICMLCALTSGALLLYTSQEVQDANRALRVSSHALREERETLRILEAEWAFLSAPSRLEAMLKARLSPERPDGGFIPVLQKQAPGASDGYTVLYHHADFATSHARSAE